MAAGEHDETGGSGDQGDGAPHFRGGAEGIAGAVHEEGGDTQTREVSGAEFGGVPRRMERVGKEEKAGGGSGIFGGQQGGLPAPVGMAAEEDAAGDTRGEQGGGFADALAVAFGGGGGRRPVRPRLAEGQVYPQNGEPAGREGCCRRSQDGRGAIRSGSMGEHQAVAALRPVEKSAHPAGGEGHSFRRAISDPERSLQSAPRARVVVPRPGAGWPGAADGGLPGREPRPAVRSIRG